MRKILTILIATCLLLSGLSAFAYAGEIQSNELTPVEADAFSQAQADSAQTINTIDNPGHIVEVFAVIGIVVVALIIVAAVK